jgi:hypothetical protein
MKSARTLPRLVGITGRAGAGKDTLADFLVERCGYVKYSLATPLKLALNAAFGFTPEQWEDRAWKEQVIDWIGKSPRQLAQTLGTEWGRTHVAADIWLRCADRFIEQADRPVVIADVRFANEAVLIHRHGGRLVKVSRPGVDGVAAHASENGVDDVFIHHWAANTSTPDALGVTVVDSLRLPLQPIDHHLI